MLRPLLTGRADKLKLIGHLHDPYYGLSLPDGLQAKAYRTSSWSILRPLLTRRADKL